MGGEGGKRERQPRVKRSAGIEGKGMTGGVVGVRARTQGRYNGGEVGVRESVVAQSRM